MCIVNDVSMRIFRVLFLFVREKYVSLTPMKNANNFTVQGLPRKLSGLIGPILGDPVSRVEGIIVGESLLQERESYL